MTRKDLDIGLTAIAERFSRPPAGTARAGLLFEIYNRLSAAHWASAIDRLLDDDSFPLIGDINRAIEATRSDFPRSGQIAWNRIVRDGWGTAAPQERPHCGDKQCAYCAFRREVVGVILKGASPNQIADLLDKSRARFDDIDPSEIAALRRLRDDWTPPPETPVMEGETPEAFATLPALDDPWPDDAPF